MKNQNSSYQDETDTELQNMEIRLEEQNQQLKIMQQELKQKQIQINQLKQNENNIIKHINEQNAVIQKLLQKIDALTKVQQTQTKQLNQYSLKINELEIQIQQLQPKTETFNSQQYLSNNMGNMSLSQMREEALNRQIQSCGVYPLKYNIIRFKKFILSCSDARITFLNGPVSIDDNLLAISNIKKCFSDASSNQTNFIRNSLELSYVSFMSQPMDCVFWVLDLQTDKLDQQELYCLFKGMKDQLRIITVSDVGQNFICIRQASGNINYYNSFEDMVEQQQSGIIDSRIQSDNTYYSSRLYLSNTQMQKQSQLQFANGLLEVIACQSNGYDGNMLSSFKMSSLISVGQANLMLSYPQEIISLTLVQSNYKTLDALHNVENLVLIQVPVDIQQIVSLTKLKRILILQCFNNNSIGNQYNQSIKSQGFIGTSFESIDNLIIYTSYFLQMFQNNPLEYVNIYDDVFMGQVVIDFEMPQLRFLSLNFHKQEDQENKLIINQKLAKINNLEACTASNVTAIEVINGQLQNELLQ